MFLQGSRSSGKLHTFGKREHSIKRNPNVPAVVRGWLYKQARIQKHIPHTVSTSCAPENQYLKYEIFKDMCIYDYCLVIGGLHYVGLWRQVNAHCVPGERRDKCMAYMLLTFTQCRVWMSSTLSRIFNSEKADLPASSGRLDRWKNSTVIVHYLHVNSEPKVDYVWCQFNQGNAFVESVSGIIKHSTKSTESFPNRSLLFSFVVPKNQTWIPDVLRLLRLFFNHGHLVVSSTVQHHIL